MKRRTKRARRSAVAALWAAVILGICLVWLWWALAVPVGNGPAQRIEITRGISARFVGRRMAERGLVRSGAAFALAAVCRGKWRGVREGVYDINPAMNAIQILKRLERGLTATEKVTIPEGFAAWQIAGILEEKGLAGAEEFMQLAQNGDMFKTAFPKPAKLEGYLFPDTYLVPMRPGAASTLISMMLARFQNVVWEGLLRRQPPAGLSLHQLVTLASLVEGEAKVDEERPIIARVLLNRLRLGKELECDASIQYILGSQRKSRLLWSDTRLDSPYNTYLHAGLPPGPIDNPGRASIEASLHPANTPYLYYVASDNGRHIFSRTLEEHQRAVRQVRSR